MFRIRKKFKFEYAHQLNDAFSSCCSETIHGHSAILELFFISETLDGTGMIVDFGRIKELFKDYINEWDHSLIMPSDMDEKYIKCLSEHNQKLMIVPYNPTAENLARNMFIYLSNVLKNIEVKSYKLEKVRFHETDTGWAEYGENKI